MRLSDIEVDEVSLVDKAANKRKFAFMKRDNTEDHKKTEKTEEIKESEKLITPANTDDPTPEQIAEFGKLVQEVNELTALLTKKA